jgi:RHS repeat-associated protein
MSVTCSNAGTDTYSNDAVGNRLTKNSTSYSYDDANQLTSAGGTTYGYDNNGNQISRGADTLAWDRENRLTSATIGGPATTYTYNGDGLRQTRTSGGNTTSYVWDVAARVPMLLQDGTNAYVYGRSLVSMTDASGAQTYRLTDGLGSTAHLADGAGNVTGSYTYDVFGAARTHTGASTEYSFTGEQNDPNGLEYLRARYYDNATGRFLSGDPLGSAYRYAGNNPVNMVDPRGLYPICGAPSDYGPLPCFDSTEVGLPADPPVVCGVYGICLYDHIWYQTGGAENLYLGGDGNGTASACAAAFNCPPPPHDGGGCGLLGLGCVSIGDVIHVVQDAVVGCAIWGAGGALIAAPTGGGIVAGAVVGCAAGAASAVSNDLIDSPVLNAIVQCGNWGAAGAAFGAGIPGAIAGCSQGVAGAINSAVTPTGTGSDIIACLIWVPTAGPVGCLEGGINNIIP